MEGFLDDRADYAQKWAQQAQQYESGGIYEAIAQAIGEIRKGIHVDVGFGNGNLLRQLARDHRKATLIGVEINEHAIRATRAQGFKGRNSPQIHALGKRKDLLRGGELIKTEHIPSPNSPDLKQGEVYLVLDDIVSRQVIKALLEGRPIHSGSFSFPGAETLGSFQAEISRRQAVVEFFSETMVPGGRWVVADRYSSDENPTESPQIRRMPVAKELLDKYWHLDQTRCLKAPKGLMPINLSVMGLDAEGTLHRLATGVSSENIQIGIHTFVRNERVYSTY